MNERSLTTLFGKYLEKHPRQDTETYEIKMCRGSLAFSQVQPHQIDGLQASLAGLWYKISDSTWGTTEKHRFTFKKPFDGIFIKSKRAYVVAIFYSPRKYKAAVLIRVEEFIKLRDTWKKKSIKLEELDKFKFETFYL